MAMAARFLCFYGLGCHCVDCVVQVWSLYITWCYKRKGRDEGETLMLSASSKPQCDPAKLENCILGLS